MLFVIICLLLISVYSGGQNIDIAIKLYKEGKQKLELKDYKTAKEIFEEIVRSHSNSKYAPYAQLMLGYIYINFKDIDKSIEAFTNFINQYPNYEKIEEAYLRRGNLFFGRNEYNSAKNDFLHLANSTDPNNKAYAFVRLAEIDNFNGMKKEAIRKYAYICENFSDTNSIFEAKRNLAELYLENKNTISADDISTTVLSDALYMTGEVYYQKRKQYASAIEYFQALQDIAPSSKYFSASLFLMGRCYILTSQWDKAKQAYKRIVTDYRDSSHANESQQELVRIAIEQNDWGKVLEEVKELMNYPSIKVKLYGIYYYYQACKELKMDNQSIISLINSELVKEKDNLGYVKELKYWLVRIYVNSGQLNEAILQYSDLLQNDKQLKEKEINDINTAISELTLAKDKLYIIRYSQDVIESLYQALVWYITVMTNSSVSYIKYEDYINDLTSLMTRFPNSENINTTVLFQLGDLYLKRYDYNKCYDFFKQLIDRYPNSPKSTEAQKMIIYLECQIKK